MNCERVQRLLGDYLDEQLEPSAVGGLENHLDACQACSAQLCQLVDDRLQQPQWKSVRASVVEADPAGRGAPPRSARRASLWISGIAAAAAIFALATWSIWQGGLDHQDPGSSAVDEQAVLQRIRRGPVDVHAAAYSLQSPGGLSAQMLFLGAGLRLVTVLDQGRLIEARGGSDRFHWNFDALAQQLSLSDRPLQEPSPLDGVALADYLQQNFELDYRGVVEVNGHRCWLLVGAGSGQDRLRVYVDEVSSLVRRTEREDGGESPRIMMLSDINLDVAKEAFSPTPYLDQDTTVDVRWKDLQLNDVPAATLPDAISLSQHHHIAIFDSPVAGGDQTLRDLSVEIAQHVLGAGDRPEGQTGYSSVWFPAKIEQTGPGFLDPASEIPEGLRRNIQPEVLSALENFRDLLALLEREHDVKIELGPGAEVSSDPHRYFSAVPVAAWLPLNTLAAQSELRIDCEGDVVRLSPR